MIEYRLYRLDDTTQRILSAKDLMARDDLDALKEAQRLCETHAVEIWQGKRCVARVKKGNDARSSPDQMQA